MLSILALCVLAPLVPQAPSEPVVFESKSAHALALTYELESSHELLLEDMYSQVRELAPVSFGASGSLSTDSYARWRDDHFDPGGAQRMSVKRHYQKLQQTGRGTFTSTMQGTVAETASFGSNFQGRRVAFEWVPDEGRFGHCYDYYDGPEEPLGGLCERADGRSILPAGPVSVGQRWTVGVAELVDLVAPGGNLNLLPAKESMLARTLKLGLGGSFADVLSQQSFGQATIVFRALEQNEAGEDVGVLGIEELALQGTGDRIDLYEELMMEGERAEPAATDHVSVDFRYTGGGELRWNLTQGRLIALSLSGDMEGDMEIAKIFVQNEVKRPASIFAKYRGLWKLDQTASIAVD